ncbi:MAG: hypothetical protein NTY61_02685 [Candidatus Parcubacteria bacterium]|nr:hypothetical protein [Candidatus Parcubacteria bacterium]
MPEQQLVDYLKKAQESGQADNQTRALLYKNGWTEAEVSEAFATLSSTVAQPQMPLQTQPQVQPKPQPISQPEPEVRPQAQIQTVSQPNAQPQMRVRSHLFSKLLIVFIILVVIGSVGYFFAGKYLNLPWNLFRPNPETVISNMMTNMKSIKSNHTVIKAEINIADNNQLSQGKFSFNMTGDNDISDANNQKASFVFNISVASPSIQSTNIQASVIALANAFYFKIGSITPDALPYPGLDFSKIVGNWFKFDQDSTKAILQASGVQAGDIQVPTNNIELAQKIRDLISAENMLTFNKQLSDEVVSGQDTYHYLLTISKDKIKDVVGKIISLQAQQLSQTQANQTTGNSAALMQTVAQSFVNSFSDAMGNVNVEVWIGKKDFLLYQIKVDKVVDLSKISSTVTMQSEIKLNMTNSDFNKPVVIQEPQNSQKIEEVILPLIKAQKINSDMIQIGSAAQNAYNATGRDAGYYLVCKNGLLNGSKKTFYGEIFIGAVNYLIKQGAKNPSCFAGLQGYCVSTQLADGSYLCIDEAGVLGKIRCTASTTVCK